jgi:endonuclease YncB( thermonuclease family)
MWPRVRRRQHRIGRRTLGPGPGPFRRRRYGGPLVGYVLVIILAAVALWHTGTSGSGRSSTAATEITGVASITDGDSVEIHGTRIRLHGIDAPEGRQICVDSAGRQWRCGQQASLALSDRIGRTPITCRRTDTDHYGRMIAVCHQDSEDLNAWLVAEGWAVAYRRYSRDYVALEEQAKAAGRGIWSSRFVMPWDWRRGQRIVPAEPAAERRAGCNIKGNINRSGERIYHVPGGRWYDQTRIDESRGQRWSCSEDAARAAGWRRSRR